MAASLQAAATLMPAKIGGRASSARPSSHVARAFGVDAGARITCSLQSDIREVASKCADAAKMAGFALATSALLVSGASAEGAPKRLTFDEIQSKTYMEVKGTGTANQCPTIDGGVDSFPFKAGKYEMKKFCLEPTSFTVKAEGIQKNEPPAFQKTKLMTRLTYTLDEMEGPLEVGADGTLKFEEKDGIDYAAVTVQLPGGERGAQLQGFVFPRPKGPWWLYWLRQRRGATRRRQRRRGGVGQGEREERVLLHRQHHAQRDQEQAGDRRGDRRLRERAAVRHRPRRQGAQGCQDPGCVVRAARV
ncbi:unnamed protein product [Triticum turgidum subsp. durum]|uniref:Uncharacterized protein n=1 Tax=Triticum turgidum subsp. durum TaxID=4567 RepID=A0A9R1PML4_TRITD|nr:unnamed protein product [Triticum turgidum subsp. durum]